MLERIKDFLHDFSDVFLAIFVGSIICAVLYWNLGSWFNNSSNTVLANNSTAISDNQHEGVSPEIESDEEPSQNQIIIEIENQNEEISNEPLEEQENNPMESEHQAEENQGPEVKVIVIPNGTVGTGVARILQENGLIENPNDFIQAVENLNLASKLKSGTFEIPSNTSVEDMAKIIAGQKKI